MAFVNLDDPAGPPDIQIYCIGLMWPTLTVKGTNGSKDKEPRACSGGSPNPMVA